jgi:hypothetical protein
MRTEQVLGLVPARLYQRRDMNCCCICRLGETLGGGLATVRVDGSTMGMALRVRWASGWCSLVWELFCWKPTGVYGFGAVDRTNEGVGCSWCCRGDCSGDPLDSEERSEPDEWMDCSCSSSVSACLGRIRRQGFVGGKYREASDLHHPQ